MCSSASQFDSQAPLEDERKKTQEVSSRSGGKHEDGATTRRLKRAWRVWGCELSDWMSVHWATLPHMYMLERDERGVKRWLAGWKWDIRRGDDDDAIIMMLMMTTIMSTFLPWLLSAGCKPSLDPIVWHMFAFFRAISLFVPELQLERKRYITCSPLHYDCENIISNTISMVLARSSSSYLGFHACSFGNPVRICGAEGWRQRWSVESTLQATCQSPRPQCVTRLDKAPIAVLLARKIITQTKWEDATINSLRHLRNFIWFNARPKLHTGTFLHLE